MKTATASFSSLRAFAGRAAGAGLASAYTLDANTTNCLMARLSSEALGGSFCGCQPTEDEIRSDAIARVGAIKDRLPALAALWGDPSTWPAVEELLLDKQPASVRVWWQRLAKVGP